MHTITSKEYSDIEEQNEIVISELKSYFGHKKTITLVGKGETAQYIEEDAIGINQALMFTNHKFLFFNDFEALFGIEYTFPDIEYIFMPDFPHIDNCANISFSYKNAIEYLKKYGFKGKTFIYQLYNTPRPYRKKIKYNLHGQTTTFSAMLFFHDVLNKKHFDCFGINMGGVYHSDLKKLNLSIIQKEDEKYKKYFNNFKIKFDDNFDSAKTSHTLKSNNKAIDYFKIRANNANVKMIFN